jgi:hypothetical protein
VRAFLIELYRRDARLTLTGGVHAGLAVLFLIATRADPRTVLGLDPWVKPFKFAVSIAIYTWTVAWLLGHVKPRVPRAARLISSGIAVSMLVEIACIAGQSLRGAQSHFNVATLLDAVVFAIMGAMIGVNTLLVAALLVLFVRHPGGLPAPYLWGIRLGLALLLAGSLEGALMIVRGAHGVGAPDGGPGLPVVNWSTTAGDLRAAHALALHGVQVLPLLGAVLSRTRRPSSESARVGLVFAFAALHVLAFVATLAQALSGRPLIRM